MAKVLYEYCMNTHVRSLTVENFRQRCSNKLSRFFILRPDSSALGTLASSNTNYTLSSTTQA